MDQLKQQQTFYKLKPICDDIIKSPTSENLQKLTKYVSEISHTLVEEFGDYISYPIVVQLENKSSSHSEDFRKELVDTLKIIISRRKIHQIPIFFRLYFTLLLQVHDTKTIGYANSVHEELKLSVMIAVNTLIKNISFSIIDELYIEDHESKLAQGVFLCIKIAQREKFRSLRVAALECLMSLTYCHDEADNTDIVLKAQTADVFMNQLPGISSGLQEIIFGDEKQGHLVTLTALRAWGRIVSMIMRDETRENDLAGYEVMSFQTEKDSQHKQDSKNTKRDEKWLKETVQNLKWHVNRLKKLQSHQHPKVRLELVAVCDIFIKDSIKNLSDIISCILDILIALSEDEYDNIKLSSQNILNFVSNQYADQCNNSLSDMVEENFYNLVNKLPRIMNGSDVSEQMFTMDLLIGHLRILGNQSHILNSVSHLHHLITALVCISELQHSNVSLLEEYSLRDWNSSVPLDVEWKKFKHLHEQSMQNKLYKVCHLLGRLDAIDMIANYLLDLFLNDLSNTREIILILNEVLSDKTNNGERKVTIARNIIDEYLNPTKWYLPVQVDENSTDQCKSALEAKNNVIQMCLMTEGIGKIALGLGKCFEEFLIKTLYFLLERAGNSLNSISNSGIVSLVNVSTALEYKDVKDLLVANADYIEHYIIIKLRRIESNKGVLDVLSIIMTHCSLKVLPSLQHIVQDVLLQSCDTFKEHNLPAFLKIFKVFMDCVKKWQEENRSNPDRADIDASLTEIPDDLNKQDELDALDQILKDAEVDEIEDQNKTAEQMYLEDLKRKDEEKEELNEEPQFTKPKPPPEIELTVSVLRRCLNFLPSKEKDKKLLVLDILNTGINVVKNWEDELLPLVHLIWSPLENRFQELSEPLVVHHSVLLLRTLAVASKDFIRNRTSKKVLPDLCMYLRDSSKESRRGVRNCAYNYSQAYKLQLALVNSISEIAVHLDVADQHLEQVILSLVPYLSSLQPIPLQEACLNSLKVLMKHNAEFVQKIISPLFENTTADMKKNLNIVECQLNLFVVENKSVK